MGLTCSQGDGGWLLGKTPERPGEFSSGIGGQGRPWDPRHWRFLGPGWTKPRQGWAGVTGSWPGWALSPIAMTGFSWLLAKEAQGFLRKKSLGSATGKPGLRGWLRCRVPVLADLNPD